jgi:hypothetical protein
LHVELVNQASRLDSALIDVPRPTNDGVVCGQNLVEIRLVDVVEAGPGLTDPSLRDEAAE